ncbi:ExbD/TolR family protein [Sphingobacterium sp. SYP-B4668]|uniref:ExbD/TolR family protein n=1 Tax=Sphingobacterium sp. SYP-B4668 TaxID=2996035 RepID=UPI000532606C|nr:biopolymer transporter ExbD [Sphingobacterium sp. SYP-B4668]
MAELNNAQKQTGKKGRRGIRNNGTPKVDLTAMVDLAFLLITFFMLTTSLNTPNSLAVAMPDKTSPISKPILLSEDRTINLLLGGNNEITYYKGAESDPKETPRKVSFGKFGLRELLMNSKTTISKSTNGQEMIVLIKPSDESVTKNLVDVLDEVQKADVKRFMITKISQVEREML